MVSFPFEKGKKLYKKTKGWNNSRSFVSSNVIIGKIIFLSHVLCPPHSPNLDGERHCESKVSWPRTQQNDPDQGSNPDRTSRFGVQWSTTPPDTMRTRNKNVTEEIWNKNRTICSATTKLETEGIALHFIFIIHALRFKIATSCQRATSFPGLFPWRWEGRPSHLQGKSPGNEVGQRGMLL